MNKFQSSNHHSPQSSPLMGEEKGGRITRRGFLGFFLLGGLISLLGKKVKAGVRIEDEPRKAMFWRKADA